MPQFNLNSGPWRCGRGGDLRTRSAVLYTGSRCTNWHTIEFTNVIRGPIDADRTILRISGRRSAP